MAMLTIGGRKLPAKRSADLDEKLIALTGCGIAEHVAMLGPTATPGQIARVAAPMLTDEDAPSAPELAALIADADVLDIRAQVLALLGKPVAAKEINA
jgi:hypothetical protein